ncbi:PREDICTED: tumor necrosis factor-like [Cyprinodon variegatus]|uniref:tumor necrosis factor-like n=1 Tax=Cyprinodon variegatus TaxID=28743 RepID=UPI0007427B3A|nr:PREDICTED: tumor necrosis factor-like [Cyprinodon variegatus]
MEEEKSSCCAFEGGADPEAEADLREHGGHLLIRLQREKRRTRMAQFMAAGLLLLLCGVLAILYRIATPMDSAPNNLINPDSGNKSTGISERQHSPNANGPPSAMLTVPNGQNTHGDILLWETELGNARIQGGFKYSNGNLIVPRDGIYRVYLQITYSSESAEANGQSVCNKVNVISLSYEKRVPLLSACDTIVFSKTPWKKSLFTSGSFRLYAKDKLLVTSSHSNYIFRNEHEGFFGAELVFDNL